LRQARLRRAPLAGSAAREYGWLQHLARFHAKCLVWPASDNEPRR
jgi:hypothetical protein